MKSIKLYEMVLSTKYFLFDFVFFYHNDSQKWAGHFLNYIHLFSFMITSLRVKMALINHLKFIWQTESNTFTNTHRIILSLGGYSP